MAAQPRRFLASTASWDATTKIRASHPWLGVGPGNFGDYYPRYMAETAGEKLNDPHNFVLELWATGGIFVLLAVLTALAALFVSAVRGVSSESAKPQAASDAVRWEYYLGGVMGLLLGFALRLPPLNDADAVLQEGIAASARSLVWFFAFALFERIQWTDQQRVVALTAGIAALLATLSVSGGIGFPSVAGPLWFAAALLMASLARTPFIFDRARVPSLGLPVPILGSLFLIYVIFCFYPVSSSLSTLRETENVSRKLRMDRVVLSSFCASTVGLCASNVEGMSPLAAIMLRVKAPDLRYWGEKAPTVSPSRFCSR